MLQEPIANDPNNPLITVLIYDYYGKYLAQCLDSILHQEVIQNLEVILVDEASNDNALEIALDYAQRYPGLITIRCNGRHKEGRGYHDYKRLGYGKYLVLLSRDDAFVPAYVKDCVTAMEADPFATFAKVTRRICISPDWPNVDGKPLVNVLIHNYNYGRYLRQCLDSVFAQPYDNIAIIFSDNASTDDSWKIALEYARDHHAEMTLIRNRRNFGPATNLANCYTAIEGKYFCILCSDDALAPGFIQDCVKALEANPDAAFAMTHRAIIDEVGTPTEEPPFYNQSCLIPGPEQAAVYMMAAVNPSISQIMYSRAKAFNHLPGESLVSRWFAQRILDFDLVCHYPMVYLKEPLLIHRVHSASDSWNISSSLMEAFGQFILPHQFVEMASRQGNMDKAVGRLPQALEKLGRLCLRYATKALLGQDPETALRYFHLSAAILSGISQEPVFQRLQAYWIGGDAERARILAELAATENLTTRTVTYDPPPGSTPL
jgi:glycosyltransferase involved in cell wall biosynthesis